MTDIREVTSLRPPVRQSVLVRSARAHSPRAEGRAGAWTKERRSAATERRGKAPGKSARRRAGKQSRVCETWADGTEVNWGELLAWEPPERFAMTWEIVSSLTEVELTFAELGPALTRVCVVHSGWEKLSDEQLAEDCALPGGYLNRSFDKGWAFILARFAEAAS
jgi:uncharacterized protein YndB with AHSA1/START domain